MARTDFRREHALRVTAQMALHLGGLLGQDVALERLGPRLMPTGSATRKRFLAPLLVFILGI
jgi:hypothetical protein